MLDPYTFFAAETPAVLTGRRLTRRLRKHPDATSRALTAVDLAAGCLQPTLTQARQLCGASYAYCWAVSRLGPFERAAVERGDLKLADIVRRKQPQSSTDQMIVEQVVRTLGPNNVLAALDRITKPVDVAAE
jgi:hypothetical protein